MAASTSRWIASTTRRSIAVTKALVDAGIGVIEVVHERESLEKRFLEITGGLTGDIEEGDS